MTFRKKLPFFVVLDGKISVVGLLRHVLIIVQVMTGRMERLSYEMDVLCRCQCRAVFLNYSLACSSVSNDSTFSPMSCLFYLMREKRNIEDDTKRAIVLESYSRCHMKPGGTPSIFPSLDIQRPITRRISNKVLGN